MYIVKQAVDLHDGTIAVVSELDKGTTITINMPRQH
jgi:signal transduction histidine kinase